MRYKLRFTYILSVWVRSSEIRSYHRPKVNGIERNNVCSFSNCNFETDQTRFTNSQSRQRMFTNWDTKGISLYGCTFKNTNAGLNVNLVNADRGTGLYTMDASMIIQDRIGYTIPGNTMFSVSGLFYDLQIGIDDYHTTANPLNGHIIKKNNFDRNIYSIQQTNASSSHIYRNNFKLDYPTGYPTYAKSGFWGINAGGFQISENTFTNTVGTNFNEIGSTFKNSEFSGGGLYMLNSHTATNVGGQTQLQNLSLNYKCNNHSSVRLTGINLNPLLTLTSAADPVAWLPFFGSCPLNPKHKKNNFTNNSWDIRSYNNFFYKDYIVKDGTGNPYEPDAAICQDMNIIKCFGVTEDNCAEFEPAEPNGWYPVDTKKPIYLGKKAGVINDKLPIQKGAASSLLNLIGQGSNVTANDLYDTLYACSPYLSDAVLIAMLPYSQHLSEQ